MPLTSPGLHHLHKRKRIHKKLEEFPHPNKTKRFLDYFVYVIAVVIPLMTLPQAYTIWVNKDASGVSLITWSAYCVSAVVWLIYGIAHKDKHLILAYIFWLILNFTVALGVLIYG